MDAIVDWRLEGGVSAAEARPKRDKGNEWVRVDTCSGGGEEIYDGPALDGHVKALLSI
jgi:hypothetical protein